MWKPLYPVCRAERKQDCRESEICERIRFMTPSLNGPLSVCTKRFCYCRTPGSVGPSTDTQPKNTSSAHSRSRTHGHDLCSDLSTPCRLGKVSYSSLFRLYVDGGCVKSILLLILHFLDTPDIHQTYLG